ncbi:OLC1v1033360C1 [Oldenlandia corymbosa var. corymbosa]|uniref:OLC1v1033360C1 n=1 Tax=Oldenlandia corymbosa var. corymbosa TaxID=529605 RepID=A0AAV1CN85_OLDCO|nr:OLC1v1033360C1 [Oldenlandia corymbosa var. corymbosa]
MTTTTKFMSINVILILLLLVPLVVCHGVAEDPEAVEKWFKKLPSAKQHLSKLHFYIHDIMSGDHPTTVPIASANSTASSPTRFGLVYVMDSPLTEGPELSSKQIGRCQGTFTFASQSEIGLLLTLNFVFTDGHFKGSTLSILGNKKRDHQYREYPVVGGSGAFRLAEGIAVDNTYTGPVSEGRPPTECQVMVLHYSHSTSKMVDDILISVWAHTFPHYQLFIGPIYDIVGPVLDYHTLIGGLPALTDSRELRAREAAAQEVNGGDVVGIEGLNHDHQKESSQKLILQPELIPKHVALFFDGHRRWAAQNGLSWEEGYRATGRPMRQTIRFLNEIGVKVFTIFGFSDKNWLRPKARISVIGDTSKLPESQAKRIAMAEMITRGNKGIHLVVALNCGGRHGILDATKSMANKIKDGRMSVSCQPGWKRSNHLGQVRTFIRQNIYDLSNADVAVTQYHRTFMGMDGYRFSIAWTRIFPNGTGQLNQAGVDHYNNLINALLDNEIEPYVTIYDWDLPQALEDKYQGWLSPEIINDFAVFAETCFEEFGDRVKHWITFNEPRTVAVQGYDANCKMAVLEGEINNFIFVWSTVLASLCYCHAAGKIFRQGVSRSLAILPVALLFFYLPLNLNSVNLGIYAYKQFIPQKIIWFFYCLHIYFTLEIILASVSALARATIRVELEHPFNQPYLATSLQDFWGRRWNLMVSNILRPTVYDPVRLISESVLGSDWAAIPAVLATFVVSGLMHELVFYNFGRLKPDGEVLCFFLLHGVALAVEIVVKRALKGRISGVPGIVSGPLTLAFVMYTSFWLFFPPFLRAKVEWKGCTEVLACIEFLKSGRLVSPANFTCPFPF